MCTAAPRAGKGAGLLQHLFTISVKLGQDLEAASGQISGREQKIVYQPRQACMWTMPLGTSEVDEEACTS